MQLNLGNKIRELRASQKRTQEELATALGVTPQAVSRWEAGGSYPDVEIIPAIANYFCISIDELFGYENDRTKKIDILAEKINEMNRKNNGEDINMNECIALARESLIEFPNNEKLTLALASALYNAGYVRYGEYHIDDKDGYSIYDTERHKKYSEWQEAVKLYEKLLLTLTDEKMRQQAIIELSQLYKNLGEHDKALILAESAPDIYASKAFLRIKAFDGKEAIAACSEALLQTVRYSAELIESIVTSDKNISYDTAAKLIENAISMFALVCTDGFYGKQYGFIACLYMLRSYYLWLSGDHDAAFDSLDKAYENAHASDKLVVGELCYSSPLLCHIKSQPVEESGNFASELPDVWPWWYITQNESVKKEMQADPRWDEWVKKCNE